MSSEGWRKCPIGEPHGKGGGAGFPLLTRKLCAKRLVSTDELIYLRMISNLSGFINFSVCCPQMIVLCFCVVDRNVT